MADQKSIDQVSLKQVNPEQLRLLEDQARLKNWKRWGPYLSERQWGTVREDYSPNGEAWRYFSYDQAFSRAYRWGEDGLLGFTDRECRLCFALALWNEKDSNLKERLFGLANHEGNHGEDVKELYYYLDSSPTHTYFKALYKYPQSAFPYDQLRQANQARSRLDPEFEILDTDAFNDGNYFDVIAEYAKASPDDILIRISVKNRSDQPARIHLIPTLWFRNTWSWGCEHEGCTPRPLLRAVDDQTVEAFHHSLGQFHFYAEEKPVSPALFTENESDFRHLWNAESHSEYVKDAFHCYVVRGRKEAVNPLQKGTKAGLHYALELGEGEERILRFRLSDKQLTEPFGTNFEEIFQTRITENNLFYDQICHSVDEQERRKIQRQAFAGLLWSKQFYHYSVSDWLRGDPVTPTPPLERYHGRNHNWNHLFNRDIISMPDKWEYPWYAAWDLAFHMIPFAQLDPDFAKQQLILFLREWYMHPNGQIPAYEYGFDDVNPPVHAWACWEVYLMSGRTDRVFLSKVFHKLLLNFTWWVNRKDPEGNNIFAGGFLGLDNIGVFDRSSPLPTGGALEQADGSAWMAFYAGTMLTIALELAHYDPSYEDIASKFFEHYIAITEAMNTFGGNGLWDESDGFYYDQLHFDHKTVPLKVRSLVGLIPIFTAVILHDDTLDKLPGFRRRMNWFLNNRLSLINKSTYIEPCKHHSGENLLAVPSRRRLLKIFKYLFDEHEFLSPYGIRSVSKFHEKQPYTFWVGSQEYSVKYVPGESDSGLFGGNSNWRGPIWIPMNYLIIDALEKYFYFYNDQLLVEYPTGSGNRMNLKSIAQDLRERLIKIFMPDSEGRRSCHGEYDIYREEGFRDLLLFHEYFHGDTGKGLGASHQTGWTALIATLIRGSGVSAID
ncbi:MAG: hypothetical protein SFT81_07050 [Candidatus Caenarcaniphilales bacterium]|nr:hypothetical protein [Candidatus Caenarcaniphilales bacterium]